MTFVLYEGKLCISSFLQVTIEFLFGILTGITAENFVEVSNDLSGQSHYDKFRKLLAERLRVRESYVEIFSVMKNGPYVDVRYAAHGSPWYTASKLDGIIAMNKDEVN